VPHVVSGLVFGAIIWVAAWGSATYLPKPSRRLNPTLWGEPKWVSALLGSPGTASRIHWAMGGGIVASLIVVGNDFYTRARSQWPGDNPGEQTFFFAVGFGTAAAFAIWRMYARLDRLMVKSVSIFHGGPMDGQRLDAGGQPTNQFDAEFNGVRGVVVYRLRAGSPVLSGRENIHHMDYAGFNKADK
jgi:hypothetical protein